ncbi:MAG TPA: recombinase family protein [Bacillota bacterium]|nr:recombinase family protein [Bacillota bacterium]
MAALVYLRVSTEEQAERGYSIQVQRDEGLKKAVELGCSPESIYIFNDVYNQRLIPFDTKMAVKMIK